MQVKPEVIPEVEALISYPFMNPDLCWEALQGKGAGGIPHGNKRLALVGDVLLKKKHIMDWFPTDSSTGELHFHRRKWLLADDFQK